MHKASMTSINAEADAHNADWLMSTLSMNSDHKALPHVSAVPKDYGTDFRNGLKSNNLQVCFL